MKIILWIAGVLAVLVVAFYALNSYIYNEKQGYAAADHKNAEYVIEGQRVKLVNGEAETEVAPGSASKVTTKYFGNEVKHDLNNDGKEDVVFLLTQNSGGSGTFYYVVAALNTERGYVGSEALLLGDRIAPQTTEISQNPNHQGVIVVNYADRAAGEPMTTQPSVGKSIWLKLDPVAMQFGEVVQNFEGEADPSRMTLDMKKWTWVNTNYQGGTTIVPKQVLAFAVDFLEDGKFSASTDCNRIAGTYVVKGKNITVSDMISTKMFCEGSQETEFSKMLSEATSFEFTSRGQLILTLSSNGGTMTFK